jgi:asparagine synthase (glutamine-hydrolysing)
MTAGAPAAAVAERGGNAARRRPMGRMGGAIGVGPEAAARLARALGADACLLANGAKLAVEWDCCWVGGRPVESLSQWQAIIGERRLAEVHGAYALAWIDDAGALHLARDAIGERTLYWLKSGEGVCFASRLAPLLAAGLAGRKLDLRAVATYLAWAYVPGERTLVEGVTELLPGEEIVFAGARCERRRHWRLPPEPTEWDADEVALTQRLRRALEAAVRRRLPAGEPVAATLSGGIDSSLVVALAQRLHDAPVHGYSVSFGAQHRNELPWSTLVAGHCGIQQSIVEIEPRSVVEGLDDTVACLSDPIGDPLTVPNALVFREAALRSGIVLNGEGGDPLFGGPKNLPMLLAELFDGTLAGGDAAGFAREASYLRAHMKCYDDLAGMLEPEALAALAGRPLERFIARDFADPRFRSAVARLQWMNLEHKGAHHILHKVDEVSAPAGVLPRSPLFDREVAELAFAIPPQLKLRGTAEKYILKRAVADLLPEAILARPKSGMLVPVEAWFAGPLLGEAKARLLDGLAAWRIVRRDWMERLLAGKLGGLRPRRGAKIWLLVTLEAWLRRVFGRSS